MKPRPQNVLDLSPAPSDFHEEVMGGLMEHPKRLPCKYLYDPAGAAIFEEICRVPDYYLTRTESRILRGQGSRIAEKIGPRACIIEPGSGSTRKVRILLHHLQKPAAYVPVEISRSALMASARELRASHPRLPVFPVCADYTHSMKLPAELLGEHANKLIFFPGSTIGNFEPSEAVSFLRRLGRMCGPRCSMLIGVDLRKDPSIIEAAYNDRTGVTARFNKNLLARANRELSASFDLDAFEHQAIYDEEHCRIEMRLVSRRRQLVPVNGSRIWFAEGEPIVTEHSYKYSLEGFRELAVTAGWEPLEVWTDPEQLFSVHLLAAIDIE
jgi:dimethylhistidine N-methyltransferase